MEVRWLNRNIDFLFSFPSSMSYSASAHYKTGYSPIGNYYNHIRIINPFKKRKNGKTDNQYNDLVHPIIMEKNKITPLFDSEYFKWRYLDNIYSGKALFMPTFF